MLIYQLFLPLFLTIIQLISGSELPVRQQSITTIYLVRHAEKDTSNLQDTDPDLTKKGYIRANDLKKYLKKEKVSAIFSTDYKRTRFTVKPLAQMQHLETHLYKPKEFANLVKTILKDYKGKTVLIAGHSNSVLEAIEAFGIQRPIAKIDDQEYSYIFKITSKEGQLAQVEVAQYGKK